MSGASEAKRLLPLVLDADHRLCGAVSGLTPDDGQAATWLPGWSRAHVLSHLLVLAEAFIRQTKYAIAGKVVPVYDGGRPAREQAIEAGSRLPWNTLAELLPKRITELEEYWLNQDARVWDARVAYRDATLLAVLQCWWREIEIHLVDLNAGPSPQEWPPALSDHLVRFFAPRLPVGRSFALHADDTGQTVRHGSGDLVEISGPAYELASWMAGRAAGAGLRVSPVEPLPSLSDVWP